ncbi:NAD(P)H-hydrate epimerase / ADP-dependent (S)-NAD(P)H-hydrate dehydratase [hydrothermal vent metagenome]|uniref:NAD(P)H-hydrate epimerase n=1 Tax=hydrothermal vent metagenome TaxID=652676 RepID=A0A3B0TY94_9ZZZZ
MNQGVTVKQIQKVDKVAIEKYGIPSIVLMENAGKISATEIIRILKRKKKALSSLKVSIVCGLGNNAGDGFVIARYLKEQNVNVDIFLIGRGADLKKDATINYNICRRLKYAVKEIKGNNTKQFAQFSQNISQVDLIVDAIFGVGLSRKIQDPFHSIIDCINRVATKVICIDVPSGIDGTTGKIHGIAVKADWTLTFSFAKQGLFKNQGLVFSGSLKVLDIGIPRAIKERVFGCGYK